MRRRRNTALADVIRSHPTAMLPLFEQSQTPLSSEERGRGRGLTDNQRQLLSGPRSIAVADETKAAAHKRLTDGTLLGRKQYLVLDAFKKVPDATNEEIARALGWPINHVVGRTFELRRLLLVTESQKRPCAVTGNRVQAWKTNPEKCR
ncbi:MAG: hypothetical protein ACKVRP_02485 [Bacteroidota bacterium]